MIVAVSHVHKRLSVRAEGLERIVFERKTLSASKEMLMRGLGKVQVIYKYFPKTLLRKGSSG